jgi:hypothetical protein
LLLSTVLRTRELRGIQTGWDGADLDRFERGSREANLGKFVSAPAVKSAYGRALSGNPGLVGIFEPAQP